MNQLQEDSTRKQAKHGEWGIPPSQPGEQFSCVQIGDTMGEFSFDFELAWTDKINHPAELVLVFESSNGGVMRVVIGSKYKL